MGNGHGRVEQFLNYPWAHDTLNEWIDDKLGDHVTNIDIKSEKRFKTLEMKLDEKFNTVQLLKDQNKSLEEKLTAKETELTAFVSAFKNGTLRYATAE